MESNQLLRQGHSRLPFSLPSSSLPSPKHPSTCCCFDFLRTTKRPKIIKNISSCSILLAILFVFRSLMFLSHSRLRNTLCGEWSERKKLVGIRLKSLRPCLVSPKASPSQLILLLAVALHNKISPHLVGVQNEIMMKWCLRI